MVKRIEHELFSDREFLMGLRRNWLGLVAIVERAMGFATTTKEKCEWYDQQFSSTSEAGSDNPNWETDAI